MPFITLPQIPHHLLSKSSGIVSGNDTGAGKKENPIYNFTNSPVYSGWTMQVYAPPTFNQVLF
jgi:hypothetical protein